MVLVSVSLKLRLLTSVPADGAVKATEEETAEGMVHIPMTGGAIVPAYNYPGCDAKMTQTQLADVFLGKIH